MNKFDKFVFGALMLTGIGTVGSVAVATPAAAQVSIGLDFGYPGYGGYYGPRYGYAGYYDPYYYRPYYYGRPYYRGYGPRYGYRGGYYRSGYYGRPNYYRGYRGGYGYHGGYRGYRGRW